MLLLPNRVLTQVKTRKGGRCNRSTMDSANTVLDGIAHRLSCRDQTKVCRTVERELEIGQHWAVHRIPTVSLIHEILPCGCLTDDRPRIMQVDIMLNTR